MARLSYFNYMSLPPRIGVITNFTRGQSYCDLKKSAETLGVVFEQIAVPYLDLSSFTTSELVRTTLTYDAVYYRTGLRDTALDHLTSILSAANIPFINGSRHAGSHRKVQQALIAELRGIPQPRSMSMTKPTYKVLAEHLGSSFVAKPDLGAHGTDVQLIKSGAELTNLLETSSYDRHIFQELITDADEYRVYMLGNQYIASYKKISAQDDFRANLHAGGSMTATEPERVSLLARFGTEVAEAFQADIAGLDVFVKDGQCMFLELNWQPGWENLDTITGTKFSNETINYILDLIQKRR